MFENLAQNKMTEGERLNFLVGRARYRLSFLRFFPFLRFVAICNNLSFGVAKPSSDIDVFIVVKSGKLFLMRFLVTVFFHFSAWRRHRNFVAGRLCLSFFIDDSFSNFRSLAIKNDVYLAFWLESLIPIVDGDFFLNFLRKNEWRKEFLTSTDSFFKYSLKFKVFSFGFWAKFFEILLFFCGAFFWEKVLKKWQLGRAKEKFLALGRPYGVVLSENVLKFHPRDRRRKFRNLILKKMRKENKKFPLSFRDFREVLYF